MNRILSAIGPLAAAAVAGLLWAGTVQAHNAAGINGPIFNLVAKDGYVSTGDGNSVYTWGYADADGKAPNGMTGMQYPGPRLFVTEGETVTVNLTNELAVPVSIVFPGQTGVTASGGSAGLLTNESTGPADTVTYSFTATRPGTFQYHSGTRLDQQVQMGLVGTLIVRAADGTAYGDPDSRYDHESLFMLTEMDMDFHNAVEAAGLNAAAINAVSTDSYHPVYWFINGRTLSDDLFPDYIPWLPHQPYGALVLANPGQRILVRLVGGGRNASPVHLHGNNGLVIARDGALLESTPGAGADLSYSINTFTPAPGATIDTIFRWTGKGMGWDVYGTPAEGRDFIHECIDLVDNETGATGPDGYADATSDFAWEWCDDHYKRLPVNLPGLQDLMLGGFWSGSPYLAHAGSMPPGEGGLNPWDGYTFPWHSHHEVEVVNNDVFPGGNFSVFVVVPPGIPVD